MKKTTMNEMLDTMSKDASLYFLKRNLKTKLLAFVLLPMLLVTSANATPHNSKLGLGESGKIVDLELINTDQQTGITGHIRGVDGLPLPGAGVVIVGTKKATDSDYDGKYLIDAKKGDVLRFSFIGM